MTRRRSETLADAREGRRFRRRGRRSHAPRSPPDSRPLRLATLDARAALLAMPPHGGNHKDNFHGLPAPIHDANTQDTHDIAPWQQSWWHETECRCDKINNAMQSDEVCRQKKLDNFDFRPGGPVEGWVCIAAKPVNDACLKRAIPCQPCPSDMTYCRIPSPPRRRRCRRQPKDRRRRRRLLGRRRRRRPGAAAAATAAAAEPEPAASASAAAAEALRAAVAAAAAAVASGAAGRARARRARRLVRRDGRELPPPPLRLAGDAVGRAKRRDAAVRNARAVGDGRPPPRPRRRRRRPSWRRPRRCRARRRRRRRARRRRAWPRRR